ncbi:tyrosine-type recombinase/integrase [Mesorhizobium sp. M0239]|uniref:tyrosine-type recombinase/integrase n=1 Tax=Mesorhizobium sp. M0239 TaxID=2956924 RepID=UPI003335C81F
MLRAGAKLTTIGTVLRHRWLDTTAGLMWAAACLEPPDSNRPLMYEPLFGLLATTGMRICEGLALHLEDLTADGLVRQTKFQKSRLLPLHVTTYDAMDRYLSVRGRVGTLNSALFVSATARRLPTIP